MNAFKAQLKLNSVLFWIREIESTDDPGLMKAYARRMRGELDGVFAELFGEAAAECPEPVTTENAT